MVESRLSQTFLEDLILLQGRIEPTRTANQSSTYPLSQLSYWEIVIYFYWDINRFSKIGVKEFFSINFDFKNEPRNQI